MAGYSLGQEQAVLALSEASLQENGAGPYCIKSWLCRPHDLELAEDFLIQQEGYPIPSPAELPGNNKGTFLHKYK